MGRTSQKFDRQLLTLKLSKPARQMQMESLASDKAARSAKLAGSVLVRIVDGQLAVLRNWLETLDRICREVWQTQGETITPDFVREILTLEAMTAIGARVGVTNWHVDRTAGQTHEDPHAAQHHLAMEVNRLKAEVNNRYEIEVRELEYRNAPRELPGPQPRHVSQSLSSQTPMGSQSDLWKHFGSEFEHLAREQERPGMTARNRRERTMMLRADGLLYASVTYGKRPEILGERGKPEQGAFCLLRTPECGLWIVGGSVSENLRERFRTVAARAALALGSPPKYTDPEDFWLDRLFYELRENDSDHLFAGSHEGGRILHVCEASATFCSRLERKALEHAEPGKQQIPPSQPMERGSAEATGGRPPFDQDENLRNAILKKKARVAEIERILNRPPLAEYRGRPVHGGQNSRLRLEEERQHLLVAVSELEAELERSTVSRAQNSDKTVPYYIDKLIACLAGEPADLWPEFGEATPYVKQLAEIVWNKNIQWNTADEALESHHRRDALIQIICRDYPEASGKLGLQGPESLQVEAHSLEQSEPTKQNAATESRSRRLRATVNSPIAARKMEKYLESRAIGQTDFAATVGTTDRTLRSFRKTGKVRRDILESIAKQMGTTKEALLKE